MRVLFRELKAVSPCLQSPGRRQHLLFGPPDNWEEIPDQKGEPAFQMRETQRPCEARLSEDAQSGLCRKTPGVRHAD